MILDATDISPDGVRIVIRWDNFVPGSSVFIPCINTRAAVDSLLEVTGYPKDAIIKRVCIERGKRGVRVWRVK